MMSETEIQEQPSELELKVRAARAKRAEAESNREKQNRDKELELELEQETIKLADVEAISAAEAEHGLVGDKIGTIDTRLGVVIVKRPHPNVFRRFQETSDFKAQDLEKLVKPCLVHPDWPTFIDQYCKEQPATLVRTSDVIALLAGVQNQALKGK